ncbi:hypothetical protein ABB37_04979 [Leptomonas pyrrhocoris]|uniref:Uncharacterized protein n=1 Tax=Leptomonas pyrrhocoris TaxID=157538 RepID=A0A0M9G0L9_LEPPY|nr:hypothetical protein ABB37_04979 [Leptomonas pyrrhocoris]XP_015658364.1 hypothetical protein ABB37_04979 [Leptomonas pyrrhocoris]KPA79924.1 hypothetical protein ABB37_04979 [Leptomonas pyrrhocoris]KPA79925.1 hypothetical protein ABB37_04979 [Leptomonas pyrrhocoris]|eukprot:XP_015658363.1 hypothetical protein ABB37_04979 [Leptomonas pyrrhocoris]
MFAGLVATASSRSSSDSSTTPASPLSSEERFCPDKASTADGPAPSFHSPLHTDASSSSSPHTAGRQVARTSLEFLSPFSVGGYSSPSTGVRYRRPYTAQSDHSPSLQRSWESVAAGEEEGNERGDFAGEYNADLSPSPPRDHGSYLFERAAQQEHGRAQHMKEAGQPSWEVPAECRATLSPRSPSRHSSSSQEGTRLEKLAKQRSSSSSSVSSAAPREGEFFHAQREPQQRRLPLPSASPDTLSGPRAGPCVTPGRVSLSSRPVITSPPPPTHHAAEQNAVVPEDLLSPVTPPSPAAAPHSAPTPGDRGADTHHFGLRERSGTHEGRTLPSSTPTSSSAAASLSSVSTPCAPPFDSPPDSAMKRPLDTVTTEAADAVPFAPSAETDAPVLQMTAAAVPNSHDSNPLLFGVQYTEEEHRVQLETQETEERRCLFRAYKAVLTLYRMWAAEAAERAASNAENDVFMRIDGHSSTPRLVADRAGAVHFPSSSFDRKATESLNSSAASTAERVQRFLHASIDSARERRSGSATTTATADVTAAPMRRSITPTITYGGSYREEERQLPHPQDHPLPSAALTHALSSSAVSSSSSPQASRFLEYSSMLAPEARAPPTDSSNNPIGLPHRQWARLLRRQPARLFSPWRVDESERRTSPRKETTSTEAAPASSSSTRRGSGGTRFSSPLIPRIRRTSPLGTRIAATATTTTPPPLPSPHSFTSDDEVNRDACRRAEEPRPWASQTSQPPPSSAIPDAFVHLWSRRAEAEDDRRDGGAPAGSPLYGASLSPALVRSPRVALADTSSVLPRSTRRRTPPWNPSPNLRSTSAASRGVSAAADDAPNDGLPAPLLGFAPNKAFHQRQRATSLSPPSRASSFEEAVAPTAHTTLFSSSSARTSEEGRRRRERLSSYVQYKRFFDAVYGADRRSPVRAKDQRHHSQQQWPPSYSFYASAEGGEGHRVLEQGSPSLPRHSALRYADRGHQAISASSVPPQHSTVLTSSRTWSPDVYPRRAVPHPAAACSEPSKVRPSASLTPPFGSGRAALGCDASLSSDMYAARLSRLCTLEKLCRAELQRRWLEDQNALLHRFIIEGTVTLQRARAASERSTVVSAAASHGRTSAGDVVANACAWTFIPNEVE